MICTVRETSKLTAEGIIGEAVRIGVKMSGGEFPIEVFPIRIQRIISSLHDCQGYLLILPAGAGVAGLVVLGRNWLKKRKNEKKWEEYTK